MRAFSPNFHLMTEARTFTRGNLTTFQGVDHDVLQYWFREDLLIPEPAEPRKHRRFSESEAKIAALLGEARILGLNLQALRGLASGIRGAISFHDNVKMQLPPDASLDRQAAFVEEGKLDHDCLILAWAIEECRGLVGLRNVGGGGWMPYAYGNYFARARSEVVFNLDQILAIFRGAQ
jgi:DNA-binding transcriptional MerR regulator